MMRSIYTGRAVSLVGLLPLLFLPMGLTGQRLQESVVPLKNWAAPLYWQPNQAEIAERETGVGVTPKIAFSTNQVSTSALIFVAISPCRLVDTRGVAADFNGISPFSGPSLGPSTTTTFPVQSAAEAIADTTPTPCGTIPSIAQAYSFNITAIPKTAGGIAFVTVWQSGAPQPAVSTINDGEGVILANAAIVPAGTPSGGVNVLNSGPATMDLTIDMNGFYAAPSDLNGNTAVGSGALVSNTSGSDNTASGTMALNVNNTGIQNTATGYRALQNNAGGSANTATGAQALQGNTTGYGNTATGDEALQINSTGNGNTANGIAVSRQSEKFLIGQSRKFLLTAARLKDGTNRDEPRGTRQTGLVETSQGGEHQPTGRSQENGCHRPVGAQLAEADEEGRRRSGGAWAAGEGVKP